MATKADVSGRIANRQPIAGSVTGIPFVRNLRITDILPGVFILASMLLWWQSLPTIKPETFTDYGLITVLPVGFFAAMILLTLSFSIACYHRPLSPILLSIHVLALILIIHGTLALVYEAPRYAWTYKHIGVVDYIRQFGILDPTIDAYHNWPSFFSVTAFFSDITGIENFVSFVNWAQVFWNILYLAALRMLYRSFTGDQRLVWIGIWVFFLTNWVAQDYFAPQAFAFFLHLVILGVVLNTFKRPANAEAFLSSRIGTLLQKIPGWQYQNDTSGENTQPSQKAGLGLVVILLFTTVVSSHPLTPFMTLTTTATLLLFRKVKARDLMILMMVLLAAWLAYMSITYIERANLAIFGSIGQFFNNVDNNLIDNSTSSTGRIFVSQVTRLTTVGIWGLAFLGGLRRLRNGYWDLALAIVAGAPFLLLAMQSYGGEMIFRAYLFSLPGMAFFVAALLYPGLKTGPTWRTAVLVFLTSTILMGTILVTYFGNERVNHMTRNEVETLERLYNTAPRGSLIMTGSANSPTRFENYTQFWHHYLNDLPEFWEGEAWEYKDVAFTEADLAVLRDYMADEQYTNAYFIMSTPQKRYISAFNVEQADYLDHLEAAMRHSPLFEVEYATDGVTVYVLSEASGSPNS